MVLPALLVEWLRIGHKNMKKEIDYALMRYLSAKHADMPLNLPENGSYQNSLFV